MNLSKKTKARIKAYEDLGYEIIIGNNPLLASRKKWQGHHCVRICKTNSKAHGWSLYTVWAVKRR
jgi:hypothetical protein